MARKFIRKPGMFFLYLPFLGKVERNAVIEDDRCIPYIGKYFNELPSEEPELSLEDMAKEHLADILPEVAPVEVVPVAAVEPAVETPAPEVAPETPVVEAAPEGSEPGLDLPSMRKMGRPKKA